MRARELVGALPAILTFACEPPRPGENRLTGEATLTFDNRAGALAIPVSLNGITVVLDANYTFVAGAGSPAGVKPIAEAGTIGSVRRSFSDGTVNDASHAVASGIDPCSYCGRFGRVELVATVLGEGFSLPASDVTLL